MNNARNYSSEYAERNQRSFERYGFGYATQRKLKEAFTDSESRLARAEVSHQRRMKRLFD